MTTHYTLYSEISVLNEDQMRALLQAVADDQEVMDLLTGQLSLAWSGLRHLLFEPSPETDPDLHPLRQEANEKAEFFKKYKSSFGVSWYREIRDQFADMARGGNGAVSSYCEADDWATQSQGQSAGIRQYYKGKPNRYFQMVCDQMGWAWRR